MAKRLLWAVWMLCAASIAATFVMAIYEAAHPLIDPGHHNLGTAMIFVVPYVVVGATASVLRRRPAWLALLLVGTALSAAFGTWARYENLRLEIDILEARAAGQRLMICVPPPIVFALLLEYSLAMAAAGVASLRWLFGGGR
jgi:hypothetical protein